MKPTLSQDQGMTTDIRELLVRRAERLRLASNEKDADEAVMWVATFSLREDRYAIPLSALRAVVSLKMVTPVPLSPPQVVGILQFQGELLCALSLASLLGGGWRVDPATLLVVDPGGGRLVALDFAQIPMATTVPLAAVHEARKRGGEALVDVKTATGIVSLIDLGRLLEKAGVGRRDVR